MKQLLQTINRNAISQRIAQSAYLKNSTRSFSTNNKNPPDNKDGDELHPKFLEQEKAFVNTLSDKDKKYYEAYRIQLGKRMEEYWLDPKNWWNKIKNMSETEIDLLPDSYLMKFGTFLIKSQENQLLESYYKNIYTDMYQQTRGLEKLTTDEEKKKVQEKIEFQRLADDSHKYDQSDYFKRQPRLDLSKRNYNFEEFKEFTQLYERAKKQDYEDSKTFYKMVKYAKLRAPEGDKMAVAFSKKFRIDLIEIPEEFKDVSVEDLEPANRPPRSRRPYVQVKSSGDISKYDVWRVYDRFLLKGSPSEGCHRKLMLVPSLLIKAFGTPQPSRTGFYGSGEYDFEDNNLDLFNIYDYKQTTFYWGLNREDEYYEQDLKLAPHKRRRKYPSIKEFWESTEPKEFKITCGDQADIKKFVVWLKKILKETANKEGSYDEEAAAKFHNEIDICLGNYNEVGKVNTDIAIFNWNYSYFMSPDEVKKLKEKPVQYVAPKSFDFSKAERIFITKEELKRREEEEQAKLKI